ncbi:MAG: [FeFe] hydrogenase, group A [Patescibacteria group bacterium]
MQLKINGKTLSGRPGQTILEVALENGIKIPALCHHPDLEIKANCRLCLVEIKGRDRLATACSTPAQAGMEVSSDSPRVKRARATNLELILGAHTKKCAICLSIHDCELLRLARTYKVKTDRLTERKKARKTYRFANAVEIDGSQCIDCQNCVEACARQGINYLKVAGAGSGQEIVPDRESGNACVYCGQCALHCPAASAQEVPAWPAVLALLKDKTKITIAQFAPSIRVSLGEEFGWPPGVNYEGQIYTVLKKLGFQHVIDVNFGADITTMTEAAELLERLGDKRAAWPLMTSCCPAWVAYAEYYHPELLPHLTTARSPHIHSAGALKSYWAKQHKIDPKQIRVVSIMPCTAKKYEAARPELKLHGQPLVDAVLTTRELAYLIKRQGIDFKKLAPSSGDKLFNLGSGAAAIYGASGGVMESALRTAVALASGESVNKKPDRSAKSRQDPSNQRLEFREVRGLAGFKEATVKVGRRQLRVGVVNGLGNFHRLLPQLKHYHYIEVMSCPGGCIGGGGQPLPTTAAIRAKRLAGLYEIDASRSVRRAHENQAMLTYYEWVKDRHLGAQLLHTKFKRSRGSLLSTVKPGKESLFNLWKTPARP